MTHLTLNVITCSTRPGRIGPLIANWFDEIAQQDNQFKIAPVDLAEFALPVYNEPEHPVQQKYQHEHTKKWAASVKSADAYVFVTPEYNFGPPPPLLNALNYVYKEWNYKPAGIVSYGGVSGGLRAAQQLKQTLTTLKIMPIVEAVAIHRVFNRIDANKHFQPEEHHINTARSMLNELHKWAMALKVLH